MNKLLELPYETLCIVAYIVAQIIIDNLDIDHLNTLNDLLFLIASFIRLNIGTRILLEAITANNLEAKVDRLTYELDAIKRNLNI